MAMRCAKGSEKKKRQLDVLESVILFQRCFPFKAIKKKPGKQADVTLSIEGIMNESEDGGKSEVDESGFAGAFFESKEHTYLRAGAVAEIHDSQIKPGCDFAHFIACLLRPFWTTSIIKYHGWFTIQPAFLLGNRCCNLLFFSNLV